MAKNKNNKQKKVNNKKVIESFNGNTEYKNIFKYIIVVGVILVLVYLLTVYITKNSTDSVVKKKIENTTIQYDEILAGTSFKQKDSEYYVLFFNVSEDTDSTYYSLKGDYEAKDDVLPIYYVDLGNSLNKSIVSKEDNKEATKSSELKISKPTLIKFKDGQIEEYINEFDEIKEKLS